MVKRAGLTKTKRFLCCNFCEMLWFLFLAKPTVTGISYLDMLENYLMSHLWQDRDRGYICQQDEAAPHFHCETTSYLNRTVIAWIGCGGTIAWPLQSPYLTPLDFSVW